MTKYNSTQEEGILLFEASGFIIKVTEGGGFYIYENDKKIGYHSNKKVLTSPVDTLSLINRTYRDKGIKIGQESIKNQFKKLMGL